MPQGMRRAGCISTAPAFRCGALLVIALGLLIADAGAAAADADPSAASSSDSLKQLSLSELMNVTVTSVSRRPEKISESPSAIQVITADDIRRSGATSIPEALQLADNLDVAQKDAQGWAISARGFNTDLANKLLVMIDGRSVYTPLFSGVFWDHQDYLLEDIDRIEVISGPGGSQWGANAVNGVINIITKRPKDTQGLYVEGGGGSELEDFAGIRYGAELAPNVYMRVYGKTFDRGHEMLADGTDATDAWHHSQGGFRLSAAPTPVDNLNLQGDVYDGNEESLTGGSGAADGGNLLGRWSHHFSEQDVAKLQVYWDRTHFNDPVPAYTVNSLTLTSAGTLTDDLNTYDVDFNDRFRWIGGLLVWGLGYRYTHDVVDNAPGLAFLPPVLDQDLYSATLQDEITFWNRGLFTVGSKLEHNAYTGYEVEPSLRLRWSLAPDQTLWAAVSRAVRTPSRIDRDLSEPAPSAPLVVLQGCSCFRSEKVVAYELGYRAQLRQDLAVSVAAYSNDYGDVRSVSVTPSTLVPFYFQNNVEGETHGVEFSTDYQVLQRWRLHLGYDALNEDLHVKNGQFDLSDAQNEIADPAQRIYLRSSLDLPQHLQFDTDLRWIDERKINNGPAIGIVPSYGEMNLRLGWKPVSRLEVTLVGQNLLHDQHAEYGYPGPTQSQIARAVYGKLQWRY